MTLSELKEAIDLLLEDEAVRDECVHVEINGTGYELTTISIVAGSDYWVPGTIVATVEEVVAEGE
jgi:hypothetical protein